MSQDKMISSLPHGQPMPVGDRSLWDECMRRALLTPYDGRTAHVDVLSMYAEVRGISRQEAKTETFVIRYGTIR